MNYTKLKDILKINTDKKYTSEHAYITHYLQNVKNGVSKSYKNIALEYISYRIEKPVFDKLDLTKTIWDVPFPPPVQPSFKFIDLFAGIGGFRIALQNLGGKCVFSSEIDNSAKQTYEANFGEYPFGDIREFTGINVSDKELDILIPDHNILAAGFPCQPFSLAGVSARNYLGQKHGFSDIDKGNLFFDIARIVDVKKPDVVFLENVKNFKVHDEGNTFLTVKRTLKDLGYTSFFSDIINASTWVPQSRMRFYMVCFKNDINKFDFPEPEGKQRKLKSILEKNVSAEYTISDKLWLGHINRTKRNIERGTGFTAHTADLEKPSKTLVARYGKDGKECLVPQNGKNPRRLTPRECARLQGFPENFILPSSNAAAYRQFGNSVAVPVIEAISKNIVDELLKKKNKMEFQDIHKVFFDTSVGAFSEVTDRENIDSQVTVTKEEKKIMLEYFGEENILHGNRSTNPEMALKVFFLYPDMLPIRLNLLFPKPDKTELRLYLSAEHGFKPGGSDIWFVFINNFAQLIIGSMPKLEWDEIGLGEQMNFKPRARLLLQLGDQLIRNETIAITELVKNAYDADASYCKVKMVNVHNKDTGLIIIEDDGWGMDIDTIKNIWFEPGSDNKEQIVREKLYSPKGRLPIGEKGIGRFGAHKLGREIILISKKAGSKEVVVKINWDKFIEYKYLKDAPVIVYERTPKIFTEDKTGTRIIIRKLPVPWTRGKLRDAFRAINAISIPSTYNIIDAENDVKIDKNPNSFEALPETNHTDWVMDIPKWQDILQYSLFFFDIEILNDKIIKFKYQFRPWDNMTKISGRGINEEVNPIKGLLDIEVANKKKFEQLNVPENINIGRIKFQGCIFVRDRSILKITLNKPTFLTDYLNENGGIRIYRDGLRVYDYGEKSNDWLNLDYRRFNDPGVKISNNLILASITLEREESSSLIEKTNREGFIENEAYEIFKNQIFYALRLIEICREPDKKRIDSVYKPKIQTESVLKSILNLRGFIDEKVKDPVSNKHLKYYVDKVEANYKLMYENLIKASSAGLGWTIYIHEIEKIIKEIEKVIKSGKDEQRAGSLVSHLSKLIGSYTQILRKSDRVNERLTKIIEQSLFNVEFRLEAHKISIIDNFSDCRIVDKVRISRNLIISTLMNIYDNSIYWLDRAGRKDKKIRIAVSDEKEGYISIVVSDNGTGFLVSPEQMTELMFSARGGMGMGLYLAKEIMEGHAGSVLSFNEFEEFKVPDEFKKGATLALCFKK